MREWGIVLIITIILLGIGSTSLFFSEFNFNKSDISVNGLKVSEKLYFKPNKEYHTLFRNFVDTLTVNGDKSNSVSLISVSCSEGQPYARTYSSCYDGNLKSILCPSFTESNEYGCSFGDTYGFHKGEEYAIQSEYNLNPANIFSIKGKNYVKFVVYSPNNHKFLSENFDVSENVVKRGFYLPNENVIIYIPYERSTQNLKVIQLADFQFDSHIKGLLIYLLSFLPGIGFFIIWFIFGKERIRVNMPPMLSMMPEEGRKPWQVSAFFSPPLGIPDKNLFASTLLDFYHRKIIDVKTEEGVFHKKTFIKILNRKANLDEIESLVMNSLIILEDKEKDWFELQAPLAKRYALQKNGRELRKEIKKESKEYFSNVGTKVMFAFTIILFLSLYIIISSPYLFFSFFIFAAIIFILSFSSLFVRYNKEYYREYCHWQAFRKYLKNSFTIREGTHKTIVIWEEYLIYATALGVPDRVIKELENKRIITSEQAGFYHAMYVSSGSFSSSSGTASGGHGGAGGGGVGGGGGGGR